MKATIALLESRLSEIVGDLNKGKEVLSIRKTLNILEAAEKIAKQKSIEALKGCFLFLANHGWNTPDPDIVAVMELLKSLPDGEVKT